MATLKHAAFPNILGNSRNQSLRIIKLSNLKNAVLDCCWCIGFVGFQSELGKERKASPAAGWLYAVSISAGIEKLDMSRSSFSSLAVALLDLCPDLLYCQSPAMLHCILIAVPHTMLQILPVHCPNNLRCHTEVPPAFSFPNWRPDVVQFKMP